jgi:cytochrome c-type biogenesis protein CcmE
VLGLLGASAAVLFFVFNGMEDATYAKTVGEVLSAKTELESRKLRVQGILVHGTLQKRDDPCEFRFKMRTLGQADSAPLDVRYQSCIIPDTFRDVKGMDVEVTAEGKLAAGGVHLEATQIFAKCPSKYEMQQRQAAGEAAPHGSGKPQLTPMDTIGKPSQGS